MEKDETMSNSPAVQLQSIDPIPTYQWKLWIYTNYDCNLRCSYCVAKSSPNSPRRSIGLENVIQQKGFATCKENMPNP